ncbi:MAG: hypothetical protein ACJAYJ_001123 [Saprospiraceae bacterium]|jgi:hypothetical protein
MHIVNFRVKAAKEFLKITNFEIKKYHAKIHATLIL